MWTLLGGEDWGDHIAALRRRYRLQLLFGVWGERGGGGQGLKDTGDRLLVFRGGRLLSRSFVSVGAVGVKMFIDGV